MPPHKKTQPHEIESSLTDEPRKPGFFRRYALWLKWPLAVGLLAWLFYRNRTAIANLSERSLHWEFAVVAIALCGGSILLTFFRWYLLVWALGFDFTPKQAIRLGFLGYISNYVSPGGVGGDAVKAVVLARQQESRRAVAVATVVLDRILGLLALFIVGSSVWLLQSEDTKHGFFQTFASIFAAASLVGLLGLSLLLHSPLIRAAWLQRFRHIRFAGPMVGELLDGVALYQSKPRVIWLAVAISIVGHWGMLSSFYFCALTLNAASKVPDYYAHLLFMPTAELAAMLPIVPGGIGVLEEAIQSFYGLAGFRETDGFLTGIGYRMVTVVISVLGMGYYIAARREVQGVMNTEPTAVSQQG